MTDLVVTASHEAKLPEGGKSWWWLIGHSRRLLVEVGDRLYVVHGGALWGYGQIAMIDPSGEFSTSLGLGAPKRTTLPCKIKRFKGHRYRWWDQVAEKDADT